MNVSDVVNKEPEVKRVAQVPADCLLAFESLTLQIRDNHVLSLRQVEYLR